MVLIKPYIITHIILQYFQDFYNGLSDFYMVLSLVYSIGWHKTEIFIAYTMKVKLLCINISQQTNGKNQDAQYKHAYLGITESHQCI